MKHVEGKNNACFQESFATKDLYTKFLCHYLQTRPTQPEGLNFGLLSEATLAVSQVSPAFYHRNAYLNNRDIVPNYFEFNSCETHFDSNDGKYSCNPAATPLKKTVDCRSLAFDALPSDWGQFDFLGITGPCYAIAISPSVNYTRFSPAARQGELFEKTRALGNWSVLRNSCPDYKTLCHGAKSCDISR